MFTNTHPLVIHAEGKDRQLGMTLFSCVPSDQVSQLSFLVTQAREDPQKFEAFYEMLVCLFHEKLAHLDKHHK